MNKHKLLMSILGIHRKGSRIIQTVTAVTTFEDWIEKRHCSAF